MKIVGSVFCAVAADELLATAQIPIAKQLLAPRLVLPGELLTWELSDCQEWKGFSFVAPFAQVRFVGDDDADVSSDLGMMREPFIWEDVHTLRINDFWDIYAPDNDKTHTKLERISYTKQIIDASFEITHTKGRLAPLLLLTSEWDRDLPTCVSVLASCSASKDCVLVCRIIHLDGSGKYSIACAPSGTRLQIADVSASGEPIKSARDMCIGRKAIELFIVSKSDGDSLRVDLRLAQLSPPDVHCARPFALCRSIGGETTSCCKLIQTLCGLQMKRSGASEWNRIQFPGSVLQKVLSAPTLASYIEASADSSQIFVRLQSSQSSIPVVRLWLRTGLVEIDAGGTSRMRAVSNGSVSYQRAPQIHLSSSLDISFPSRDAFACGILIPHDKIEPTIRDSSICHVTLLTHTSNTIISPDPKTSHYTNSTDSPRSFFLSISPHAPADAFTNVFRINGEPTYASLPLRILRASTDPDRPPDIKRVRVA